MICCSRLLLGSQVIVLNLMGLAVKICLRPHLLLFATLNLI